MYRTVIRTVQYFGHPCLLLETDNWTEQTWEIEKRGFGTCLDTGGVGERGNCFLDRIVGTFNVNKPSEDEQRKGISYESIFWRKRVSFSEKRIVFQGSFYSPKFLTHLPGGKKKKETFFNMSRLSKYVSRLDKNFGSKNLVNAIELNCFTLLYICAKLLTFPEMLYRISFEKSFLLRHSIRNVSCWQFKAPHLSLEACVLNILIFYPFPLLASPTCIKSVLHFHALSQSHTVHSRL